MQSHKVQITHFDRTKLRYYHTSLVFIITILWSNGTSGYMRFFTRIFGKSNTFFQTRRNKESSEDFEGWGANILQ